MTGIFVYMLVMSREASLVFSFKGMSFRSLIRCLVFLILKAKGREVNWLKSFASLYAGALVQYTGKLGLWTFIKPLMVGAEGLRFVYFHFWDSCMRLLLSLIIFLVFVWNLLVGSESVCFSLLVEMKSIIFYYNRLVL